MTLQKLLDEIKRLKTYDVDNIMYTKIQNKLQGIKEAVEAVDNEIDPIYPWNRELWQQIKEELKCNGM